MRFIKYFLMYWSQYPFFKSFYDNRPELKQEFITKGEKFPRNRIHYAYHLAKIRWQHRDQYSRRCTGECETCTLKHC